MRIQFAVIAAALLVTPANSQTPAAPTIKIVPANSHPPVPSWLKATCLKGPNTTESAPTCPVVKYKEFTTWAYSFNDNRVSFALVVYDNKNNIVSIATKDGARYVWKITVNPEKKTVTVWGQANNSVTAEWFEVSRGIGY